MPSERYKAARRFGLFVLILLLLLLRFTLITLGNLFTHPRNRTFQFGSLTPEDNGSLMALQNCIVVLLRITGIKTHFKAEDQLRGNLFGQLL